MALEMNWSRGLFRFWVIISVAWVFLVGVLFVPTIRNMNDPVFFYDGSQVLQFPANTPVENVRARITDYLKTKDAQATPPSQRDPVEYDAEANIIMGDYQPRYVKDDAIRSAAFAVGVPISILMVGWALLWIGRGFRRQR
jgi:hypothetical protein